MYALSTSYSKTYGLLGGLTVVLAAADDAVPRTAADNI